MMSVLQAAGTGVGADVDRTAATAKRPAATLLASAATTPRVNHLVRVMVQAPGRTWRRTTNGRR
jgi:hypothetical protein